MADTSSVTELFDGALRRRRAEADGPIVYGEDGVCARFGVRVADGVIGGVEYRATTCVTLVAVCEYVRRTLIGMEVQRAQSLEVEDVVRAVRGIPQGRKGRVVTALAAMKSALPV